MGRICVFAGSSAGKDPSFVRVAAQLGAELARRGIGLVFGAGRVGLMGAMADAALGASGEVIGVIPRAMVEREWAHQDLSQLHVVADMHERKALMNQLADAFLALPGGIGTLEELFEVYTWAQLGFHHKPVALLDVHGYYGPLLSMLDAMVDAGFLGREARALLHCDDDASRLLDALSTALA
ncbi:MAG: TIGR00730 family Rossman fold protein [Myxococcales bacterium]|nr:TIGR00730 family Rossman fold protein [Myxococcales bacterium]